MKKLILTLTIISAFVSISFAQVPNAFKYQAIACYANGAPIVSQPVSFQINIIKGDISGPSVYTETHTDSTNALGHINLEIGNGTTGNNFSLINWSNGPYFIRIAMDTTGGSNYQLMGTSQLLSVPYALYAQNSGNASLSQYSQAEIELLTPFAGMMVFNTDYKIIQFYDGTQWMGNQGSTCVPQPNQANAGPNQTGLLTLNTILAANSPSIGVTGKWTIIQGTGGLIDNDTKPNSYFSGNDNSSYILRWSLMTPCDTTQNEVTISFFTTPPSISFNGTLYVYPYNFGIVVKWGGPGTTTGATSTTDGETNTSTVVSILGNNSGVEYATKICDTLSAFGFSDWYLPSKDELNAIYLNKDAIGGLLNSDYWSSTEYDADKAWGQNFSSSNQYYDWKFGYIGLLCVRR